MTRCLIYCVLVFLATNDSVVCQDTLDNRQVFQKIRFSSWYSAENDQFIRFDSTKTWIFSVNGYRVLGIDSIHERSMLLTEMGKSKKWTMDFADTNLYIEDGHQIIQYTKTDSVPVPYWKDVILLGRSTILPTDQINMIKRELESRLAREQDARFGLTPDFYNWLNEELGRVIEEQNIASITEAREVIHKMLADTAFTTLLKRRYISALEQELSTESGYETLLMMMSADSNNVEYLVRLIQEIGWIDVERFGAEASYSAGVIVLHSGDPLLMQAVLPEIMKDCDNEKLATLYSLMYYRMHLYMGTNSQELDEIKRRMGIY